MWTGFSEAEIKKFKELLLFKVAFGSVIKWLSIVSQYWYIKRSFFVKIRTFAYFLTIHARFSTIRVKNIDIRIAENYTEGKLTARYQSHFLRRDVLIQIHFFQIFDWQSIIVTHNTVMRKKNQGGFL